jgi:hypothetical protein
LVESEANATTVPSAVRSGKALGGVPFAPASLFEASVRSPGAASADLAGVTATT